MAKQVWTNNGAGTLLAGIVAGDTALTLNAGQGARFPNPAAGDWFIATLIKGSGALEIIKVTARAGDGFTTIVRAQEGTIALDFDAGDRVELRPTAAAFAKIGTVADDLASLEADAVTDVTATAPVVSSGGATPDISLAASGITPDTYDMGSGASITVDAYGRVTGATEPSTVGPTVGTPQTTGSGTSFDFTGIPPGTSSIVVTFEGVSTDGTSEIIVQIGDGGGVETSGYKAGAGGVTFSAFSGSDQLTAGFPIFSAIGAATCTWAGSFSLTLLDAATFTWVFQGTANDDVNQFTQFAAGVKSLSAVLDRVRITTAGGDNFDAGKVNIAYG